MWLFDRIYIYSYALLLRTPSRHSAPNAATFLVAILPLCNLWAALILISPFVHHNLMGLLGRPGALIVSSVAMGLSFFCYVIRKRGPKLIREFAAEIALKKSRLIGFAIGAWSFGLPLLGIAFLIIFFPYHRYNNSPSKNSSEQNPFISVMQSAENASQNNPVPTKNSFDKPTPISMMQNSATV